MNILVAGGAGYIGSHTCVELLNEGYEVIIVDNFVNSKPKVLDSIKKITNKKFKFYNIDLNDKEATESVFKENDISAVIHFAALKAVGESVNKPIEYYSNNLNSTLVICELMQKYKVNKLIYSSSATVYGNGIPPYREDSPIGEATNPYGSTKLFIEKILNDLYVANKNWNIEILRYFNPIGAHESGLIGEEPNGIPNNLVPYVAKVAVGELEYVNVYGDDYDTIDGTGVRDYIHVVDLAKGHVKALEKLNADKGVNIYNLGTGRGYSVLQVIKSFEKVSGCKIQYKIMPRRVGDVATCYADRTKAQKILGWTAQKKLDDMCKDMWNYIRKINNN